MPGPLIALGLAGILAWLLTLWVPGFSVATIHSRFLAGIPQRPPMPALPWHLPGPDGHPLGLSFGLIRALVPLGLRHRHAGSHRVAAVVADGMTGGSHDPDAELVAQGIGNIVRRSSAASPPPAPWRVRPPTSVPAPRSPLAAIFHSGFVLLSVLLFAPVLNYLPMASLAALLLIVAWNMSEAKHFAHAVRVAPRSDVVVLLLCFGLTVIFDMVVSVTVGVVLAALLFMRRMAEVSRVRLVDQHPIATQGLPKDVLIYEVAGPLFSARPRRR